VNNLRRFARAAVLVVVAGLILNLAGCDFLVMPAPFEAPADSVPDDGTDASGGPDQPGSTADAGITVTPIGVGVTEGGADGTYTVVLDAMPTADVIVTPSGGSQISVSPGTLAFTTATWNVAQTVTVSAVDDGAAEGNHSDTISHTSASSDSDYDGISISDVSVSITDNDSAGVSVSPTTVSATEGGVDGSYDVVLTTPPASDVTISITTGGEASTTPASLTFTTATWSVSQTVTVTAVDDAAAEGLHGDTVTHTATSSDGAYDGISINNVSVSITDNDSAGVSISTGSVGVTEGGATDTYDVVLTTTPTATVTITIGAGGEVAPAPSPITFTTGNWDVPQTVTVTAVDDGIAEGIHNDTITHTAASVDPAYNGIAVSDVTASITDNDGSATLSTTIVNIDETGPTSDTISINLDSEPTAIVTISASWDAAQVTVSPASVNFDAGNWSTPQVISVTAVDDGSVEGLHNSNVTFSAASTDGAYDGIPIPNVTANITDNDFYYVTYDDNGSDYGSAPTDATGYIGGDTVTVLTNSGGVVQSGAVFTGWNTAADGSGTPYDASGADTFVISGDITLYAEWDTSNDGFAGGDGSIGTPYLVATHEHLSNVRTNLTAYYQQTANIDLNVPPWNTGTGWAAIGGRFAGVYDGQGFEIQNLFFNNPAQTGFGLFNQFVDGAAAEIRNVALVNVDITADRIVGALVGSGDSVPPSSSTIIDSYATGIVRGTQQVGGLVGRTRQISIQGSFADVEVISTAGGTGDGFYAGGLVGWAGSPGPIIDSYAIGNVTGVNGVGGLVGYGNGSTITNSYSAGVVTGAADLGGLVGLKNSGGGANNFYDTDTSGQSDDVANWGAPRTSVQMTNQFTFTGWDFGTIWEITPATSYPHHQWYTGPEPTP